MEKIFKATVMNIVFDLGKYTSFDLSNDFNISSRLARSYLSKMHSEGLLSRKKVYIPNKKFTQFEYVYSLSDRG